MKNRIIIGGVLSMMMGAAVAQPISANFNILCGTGEDGCNLGISGSCVCVIGVNPTDRCLDLDPSVMKCLPFDSTTGRCPIGTQDLKKNIICETVLHQSDYTPGGSNNCKLLETSPANTNCTIKY